MQVEVVKISQEFNMKTGTVSNLVVLRLPNGKEVAANLSEGACSTVIESFVSSTRSGPPLSRPQQSPEHSDAPIVFGGEDSGQSDTSPPTAPTDNISVPPIKRKVIGKDSHGYPLFSGSDGEDPDVSSGDRDEDGFGSL